MNSEPLISVEPADVLTFNLMKGPNPKVVLTITNTHSFPVAFKVKTTQPSWYFVRPNQHILGVGKKEEVSIALVEAECSRVLEHARNNNYEKLDKHRFLVLSKAMEFDEYERISKLSGSEKQTEYAAIWSSVSKDDKQSLKLTVKYMYPENDFEGAPARQSKPSSSSSASSLLNDDEPINDVAVLKNKYDSIVEYTVHLTAERDLIVNQLETLKKEYNAEVSKNKKASNANVIDHKEDDMKKFNNSSTNTGYSLWFLLLIATICFLIGRYVLHI